MERPKDSFADFRVGDRVQLSKLGRPRFPRTDARVGTVVHIPDPKKGGRMWVRVLFEGRSSPMEIHRSYIEPASVGSSRHRTIVDAVRPATPDVPRLSRDARRISAALEILISCT